MRVADSYDFVLRKTDAVDPLEPGNPGHGTTTASVIMSSTGGTGETFVSGVAPAATIVPLRVTARVVLLGFDRLAEAIRYASDHGCHVISMSLGGVTPSGALSRAVAYAVSQGVVVLAAAGNVWPWVVYPARLDQVIACAACNCQKGIWSKSAAGDTVDVTAPGETVWVARPGKDAGQDDDIVDVGSGTSYAVATTAGACALWLAHHGRDALITRYGKGQIASVFKEVLMTHGVDTPPGLAHRQARCRHPRRGEAALGAAAIHTARRGSARARDADGAAPAERRGSFSAVLPGRRSGARQARTRASARHDGW